MGKLSSGDMCTLIPGMQYCVSTMRLQPCFLAWLGQKLLNLFTQTKLPGWQVTQQVCSLWTWSRKCVSEFLMNTGVLSCLSECQQFLWRTWMDQARCTQHWLVNVLTELISCIQMLKHVQQPIDVDLFYSMISFGAATKPPSVLLFSGITGILMSAAGLPVCLTRPPKLVLHPPPVSKSDIKPVPGLGHCCRKTTKKQARKGVCCDAMQGVSFLCQLHIKLTIFLVFCRQDFRGGCQEVSSESP